MMALSRIIGGRAALGGAAPVFTVSYVSAGTLGTGSTNPAIPYPSSPQSGDLILLTIVSRADTIDIPLPSGFTAIETQTGGNGTGSPDTGPVRIETFRRESDGTETGNISITASTASFLGFTRLYRKTGGAWSVASTSGVNSTAGTAWSVAGSSWTVAANDMIVCASGVNGDINASAPTSPTLTMSGLSGSPVAMSNASYGTTSTSLDSTIHIVDAVVAGAATAAPTFATTYASSGASSPTGPTVFIRLRAA